MKEKKTKELTQTQKIVNIVIMAIEIVIIIACMALSITVIVGAKSTTEELGTGYNITVVLTESMNGSVKGQYDIDSFSAGDLLVIKRMTDEEEESELKVGDVVTFTAIVEGRMQLVTHRIVSIEQDVETNENYYVTRGDAELEGTEKRYTSSQIQGKAISVIPKIGYVINWFQQPTNFLLSVVIPLAVLLLYNVYIFVSMIIKAKFKKLETKSKEDVEAARKAAREELLANEKVIDEEEIKKKAIEEYLAKMQQNADAIKDVTIEDLNKKE